MSNERQARPDLTPSMVYEIRIKGHLGSQWTDWFEGLTITGEADGNTLLTGPVIDQAALHGLLKKVRDLGMPLVSVNRVEAGQADASEIQPSGSIQQNSSMKNKEKQMNANKKSVALPDRKVVLSTLWIFLTANYIYCDLLSHMDPTALKELLSGTLGSIPVTQGFLLSAALMMEIPFAMIVLARVLPYRANRWANILAGAIMTAIQVGTMGMGTAPTLHYLFYSAVEVACNLFIIWYAWTWRNSEA